MNAQIRKSLEVRYSRLGGVGIGIFRLTRSGHTSFRLAPQPRKEQMHGLFLQKEWYLIFRFI